VVGKGRVPLPARERARAGAFPALAARPVIVLFNGSDSALRALEAGHALARIIPTELSVLVTASTPQYFEERRARAAQWLAERGAAARYLSVASREPAALAVAVRSQGGGILVWPTPPDTGELAALARLIDEVGCPVVVLP
jgi:hypothetical protein